MFQVYVTTTVSFVTEWTLLLLWQRLVYNFVNMAATSDETSTSRYPSEIAVKEALDTLKPPGILSKVTFLNIVCHNCAVQEKIKAILFN